MALRAKKPELKSNRFKALIYGGYGSGKTHFCCSIPNSYFIDTEDLSRYPKFIDLLRSNNSEIAEFTEIHDIIAEVKELMRTQHNYKTLIIDSLSIPYAWLAQLEVERLVKQSNDSKEGTEFGANLAKPKRLLFHLSTLLSRLDMNVIVTCQEKTKFTEGKGGKESELTFDVSDKIAYALGTVIHFRPTGTNSQIAYFEKSRYSELPNKGALPFSNGYEVLKQKFGEEMFLREAVKESFATKEQLDELNRFIELLNIKEETYQKWLTSAKCNTFDEMNEEQINKFIEACKNKVNNPGEK